MKKYSIKHRLLEAGQQAGVAASDTSGKDYEDKTLDGTRALIAGVTALTGATADGTGTYGADVAITMPDGTIIPIESKSNAGATYGNASLSYEVGVGFDFGKQTKAGKASPQVNAIKTDISSAIDAANKNTSAIAVSDRAAQNPTTSGDQKGGGTKTSFPGLIARWYAAKGNKGADYIQIKGRGLLLMPESTDPLGFNEALKAQGLPEIPLFQPREEYINVRMIWKPKYKPYAEIKASGVPRSPYSLTEPQKLIDLDSTAEFGDDEEELSEVDEELDEA